MVVRLLPLLSQDRSAKALLMECHARIRSFVAEALVIAELTPVQRTESATRLHRYFSIGLPLHEADEEQTLAPRLIECPAKAKAETPLQQMADQHQLLHTVLDELLEQWAALQKNPTLSPTQTRQLAAQSRRLAAMFDIHLALEEQCLFPLIELALTEVQQHQMVEEMQARRGSAFFPLAKA